MYMEDGGSSKSETFFFWSCTDCVPTRDKPRHYGFQCPLFCLCCFHVFKNLQEILLTCDYTKVVWNARNLWQLIHLLLQQVESFKDLCFLSLANLRTSILYLFGGKRHLPFWREKKFVTQGTKLKFKINIRDQKLD